MKPSKQNLVLLHGWGVNSLVWEGVLDPLRQWFEVIPLDLRGYGSHVASDTGTDLNDLAIDVLERAPDRAIWCGWSLGGMVAMSAALQQPQRISKLHLVCSTPRFMAGKDWQHGSSETAVQNLSNQFAKNYRTALNRFLLLQFGSVENARQLARQVTDVVATDSEPSLTSLKQGLKLLRSTDLRCDVAKLSVPTHVVIGTEDRVINAAAGRFLHSQIPAASLTEFPTGHVPFLTSPTAFVDDLVSAIARPV